eukprot:937333_1
MQNLRDMTGQCGQPTALSQLATNITATNPSVLADAQIYKQGPQINNTGPNPLEVHNVPSATNLMQQFNHQKPMQPIPMPMQPQQQINNNNNNQQNQQQLQPHQMQMQQRNYMQHQPIPHQIMQMPQMMMPQQIMNPMQYQMPPQMYQPQPRIQTQKESKEDVINTNGTQDMKDEKEVQNELDELRPTHKDINQINQLLDETKSDDKMRNSQFMDFLRNIKNKPPINDMNQMGDQSQLWNQQFEGWNDPNNIDNMNWNSYMEAIDPTKAKDPEYIFSEQNQFVDENKDESQNMNYFQEGIRLMKNGNLNEAILAFEACVKQEPNRSEGWRYLGVCHADNENENSAISAYLKCNKLDPYDLDALLQLGVSYTNEIDPFRALNYLKQWMHNHPDYSGIVDEMDIKTNTNTNMGGGYGGSKV